MFITCTVLRSTGEDEEEGRKLTSSRIPVPHTHLLPADHQKIRAFSLSRHNVHSFFLLVELWLKGRIPHKVHV